MLYMPNHVKLLDIIDRTKKEKEKHSLKPYSESCVPSSYEDVMSLNNLLLLNI